MEQVHDGANLQFDGGKLGVLNFDGKILFTHELLMDMLSCQEFGKNTFKGLWHAKVQTWLLILRASGIRKQGLGQHKCSISLPHHHSQSQISVVLSTVVS